MSTNPPTHERTAPAGGASNDGPELRPLAGATSPIPATFSTATAAYSPGNTLCIYDLDGFVGEPQLMAAFAEIGAAPTGVQIARDPLSHRPLGLGYVTFTSGDDAASARAQATPLFVGSSLCRVVGPSQDDDATLPGLNSRPQHKQAGEGVFVKNVAAGVSARDLYNVFSKYGTVSACRVVLGDYGQPRGFAYVSFADPTAANGAIDSMNGQELQGRKLFVGPNLPRHERVHRYDESKNDFTNVFIKGIAPAVLEHVFYELFASHGPVDAYSMPLDEYGHPRGFGFVNYKHHQDALKAIRELDGQQLNGRVLSVTRAQQRGQPQAGPGNPGSAGPQNASAHSAAHGAPHSAPHSSSSHGSSHSAGQPQRHDDRRFDGDARNLYIRNLDAVVNDSELAAKFSIYGPVVSSRIIRDDQGLSRGYGFVCFAEPSHARTAISATHGSSIWGQPLYVAPAQRKDRRGASGVPAHPPTFGYYRPGLPASQGVPGLTSPGSQGLQGGLQGGLQASLQGGLPGVPMPYMGYYYQGYYGIPYDASGAVGDYSLGDASSRGVAAAAAAAAATAAPFNSGGSGMASQGSSRAGSPAYRRPGSPAVGRRHPRQRDYAPSLAAAVASAENEQAAKQVIGEALYPKVLGHADVPDDALASRLTGILLEQAPDVLLEWVDDDVVLTRRISQVLDAWRSHSEKS